MNSNNIFLELSSLLMPMADKSPIMISVLLGLETISVDSLLVLENRALMFERILAAPDGDSKGDAGRINDGDAIPVHKIFGLTAMLYCARLGVPKMTLQICNFCISVQNLIYIIILITTPLKEISLISMVISFEADHKCIRCV